MSYLTEARSILFLFLDKLERQEKKEFLLLSNQWGVISTELTKLIEKLAEKEFKSEDQLFRLALYQQFLEDSKAEIERYSKIASGVISENQKVFANAGIESAQEMIGIKVSFFQRLPIETINNFIGKSFYDGSKLDETLFANSYPAYMNAVKERLLQGVALGRNPFETARLIRKESHAPLWQSLRLARTEQMNIFRETSLMQMQKSGVCSGWQRIEQDDACDECKEANGKIYKLNESFDTHPNCRGGMLPFTNSS